MLYFGRIKYFYFKEKIKNEWHTVISTLGKGMFVNILDHVYNRLAAKKIAIAVIRMNAGAARIVRAPQ